MTVWEQVRERAAQPRAQVRCRFDEGDWTWMAGGDFLAALDARSSGTVDVDRINVPLLYLREIAVGGWYSVLQVLPGVNRDDVVAFRQRRRWWRRRPDVATALIVDRRWSSASESCEGSPQGPPKSGRR